MAVDLQRNQETRKRRKKRRRNNADASGSEEDCRNIVMAVLISRPRKENDTLKYSIRITTKVVCISINNYLIV